MTDQFELSLRLGPLAQRLVDLDHAIAELRREQGQRARVYPRLVASGQLTQRKADEQNRRLALALQLLTAELNRMRVGTGPR